MASQPCSWADMFDLFGIGVNGKLLWHLPNEDLPVLGRGSDNAVVKGVPVRVEYCSSVAAKEGDLVGKFSTLVEGDDSECASTA